MQLALEESKNTNCVKGKVVASIVRKIKVSYQLLPL